MLLSALAALAAAATFGFSSVFMARAARTAPQRDMLRLRLLARLFQSREWLLGAALQPASFALQVVALAFGPLALVQPLAATDLLFALPLLAWISRRRMTAVEWAGALLVAAGVAAFLAISPPKEGRAVPTTGGWITLAVVIGGAVVVAAVFAMRSIGNTRTTLLAVAGALTFALADVVSKAAVGVLRAGGVADLATSWYPYVLIGIGVVALVLSQSAFQSGPLQVSLPVIDTLEPTVTVIIGALILGEGLAATPMRLGAQICAGVVALAGIVLLDRQSTSADSADSADSALAGPQPAPERESA